MVSQSVLDIIMLVEVGLLAVSAAVYFVHGVRLRITGKRTQRLSEGARDALSRILMRATVSMRDVEFLNSLPLEVKTVAFLEISRNLSGAGKERLRFAAQRVGLVDRARSLCRNRRWTRRLRGARILSRLDVSDPLVETLLSDRHPAVRAQAAEWAAAHPSPHTVAAMLELLADPATQARFAVQITLLRMGNVIAEPLAFFLDTHTGRAAEAGLRVAESIAEPRFLEAALRFSGDERVGIREAAARLLGAIGGAEAAGRLTQLLGDDDARVRAAAASALGRMHYWQAGTLLAECLRDSRWRVRREAGLALRALGAPGTLLLRRAVKGDDRFAADMAEQVLELPEAAAG